MIFGMPNLLFYILLWIGIGLGFGTFGPASYIYIAETGIFIVDKLIRLFIWIVWPVSAIIGYIGSSNEYIPPFAPEVDLRSGYYRGYIDDDF